MRSSRHGSFCLVDDLLKLRRKRCLTPGTYIFSGGLNLLARICWSSGRYGEHPSVQAVDVLINIVVGIGVNARVAWAYFLAF